eukprot:Amastigsp_a841175_445.p2 type:complete len:266 gc:universal Amastigsp_a841175_445:858-61(-)
MGASLNHAAGACHGPDSVRTSRADSVCFGLERCACCACCAWRCAPRSDECLFGPQQRVRRGGQRLLVQPLGVRAAARAARCACVGRAAVCVRGARQPEHEALHAVPLPTDHEGEPCRECYERRAPAELQRACGDRQPPWGRRLWVRERAPARERHCDSVPRRGEERHLRGHGEQTHRQPRASVQVPLDPGHHSSSEPWRAARVWASLPASHRGLWLPRALGQAPRLADNAQRHQSDLERPCPPRDRRGRRACARPVDRERHQGAL